MEHKDDIRPVIDRMVQRLVAAYAPQRIVLFGSHAGGTPGRDSDIDLLIVKDTPARFIDRLTQVRHLLTGAHGRQPVDVLVLTPEEVRDRLAVGDQFVETILQDGEELYAA